MELVYLWVEEYKNIKKQGFNFSPRFECKFHDDYDENGNLKDNCTLEIKPKEHIENFFGDNINVTAVVGENGSGKSSIVKLISLLIFLKNYSKNENSIPVGRVVESIKSLSGKEVSLILKDDKDEFKKISYLSIVSQIFFTYIGGIGHKNLLGFKPEPKEIIFNGKLLKESDVISFYNIYFNYTLDSFYDSYMDEWLNDVYHKSDRYATPILFIPNKKDGFIDLKFLSYIDSNILLEQLSKITKNSFVKKFFDPDNVKIEIDKSKIYAKIDKILNSVNQNYHKIPEGVKKDVEEVLNSGDSAKINNLYFALKLLVINVYSNYIKENVYSAYCKESVNVFLNEKENVIEKIIAKVTENKNTIINDLKESDFYDFQIEKLEKSANFEEKILKNKKDIFSFKIDELRSHMDSIPPWVLVKFYQGNKSYDSLSSGEKQYLSFFINLISQLDKLALTDYKYINLFFDEIELSLHPKWHKRVVLDIIEVLEAYNINFNVFLLSHSPFILSDLPRENVIFLKDGKQEDVDMETFGANIHTLLSHGFFMENGLMGEFAKEKIQNVINFLNEQKTDLDKKDILPIIELIGEPFLKHKLKEKYYEKYPQERNIDNEINELERKLEELKNVKNSN